MPFKSKSQQRWMFAAEARNEVPKGTAERWAKHTPNIKKLPERKKEATIITTEILSKLGKEQTMRKTASQIADVVLMKIAEIGEHEHLRNILAGGLGGAISPLVGGIAASVTKPEGDPTHQFWGTLGGSALGAAALGGLGGAIAPKSPIPALIGGVLGGGLGGYGAQRYMAGGREAKTKRLIKFLSQNLPENQE